MKREHFYWEVQQKFINNYTGEVNKIATAYWFKDSPCYTIENSTGKHRMTQKKIIRLLEKKVWRRVL